MFDYDVLRPDILVEPETLISRGKDLRRLAFLTPIRALALKQPLLLPPEISVGEAAELMLSAGVRAALVVCADSVIGVLDEANVLRMARNRSVDLDRTSVWMAMTPEPPTTNDTESVAGALRAFRTQRLDHLCVVRADGSPFGILDMSAVVDWVSRQLAVIVFEGGART
jgi:CBS domain-containing protein